MFATFNLLCSFPKLLATEDYIVLVVGSYHQKTEISRVKSGNSNNNLTTLKGITISSSNRLTCY